MMKFPIRVAHIINSLEYGGAEKVLVNIVNNEDQSEVQPFVFSLSDINPLQEELRAEIPFFFYKKCPVFDFALVFKLFRKFRALRIDIVHMHGWGIYPESFLAAYLARVPVKILMDHGLVSLENEEQDEKTKYHCFKDTILSFFINRTAAFIAVSNDMKINMVRRKQIAAEKIFVIHNGIPAPAAVSGESTPIPCIEAIKKGGEPVILCSVGRLAEIKNYRTLIAAFHEVRKHQAGIKLLLVGDGPERMQLEETIADLKLDNDVFMPGFSQEVLSILKQVNVFILPSFFEGISIAMLEAMSVGLPVIASRVGGNIELIEDGRNGFLFAPDDREALVSSILTLVADKSLQEKFSKANRLKFIEHYSIDISISRYHEVYRGCFPP